jgi:hypothetical protein
MNQRLASSQAAFTRGIRTPREQGVPPGLDGQRYEVYRDLVYRNLDGLLAGGFPVLKATLPAEQWATLIGEFLADHRAQTPLFLELGQEFVAFLGGREVQGWEPDWLCELAHYERIELELAIAPDWEPPPGTEADIAGAVPRLSPLARLLCYEHPVHRIGPDHDPAPEATFLLVHRDRNDDVQFMALMPATAQLLALIETNRSTSSVGLLRELADALAAPAGSLEAHGLDQLRDFVQRGVVYYE